jgi:hypothetical protein
MGAGRENREKKRKGEREKKKGGTSIYTDVGTDLSVITKMLQLSYLIR